MKQRYLKKIFFGVFILILLTSFVSHQTFAEIKINEIMFNPFDCNDSDCEWIELFNNASTPENLLNCTINNKELENFTLENNSYLIITRNKVSFQENFQPFNQSISIIELTFSLSNSGGLISLNGTEFCQDQFNYTDYVNLANGNNHSLEKTNNLSWQQSKEEGGSPGFANSVIYPLIQYGNSSSNLTSNTNNSLTNLTSLIECDFAIEISIPDLITTRDNFTFDLYFKNKNSIQNFVNHTFSVRGRIQDIYGNMVKGYSPWTDESSKNNKSKTYSPNLNDGTYLLNFSTQDLTCKDSELKDNNQISLFVIGSNLPNPDLNSSEIPTDECEIQNVNQITSSENSQQNLETSEEIGKNINSNIPEYQIVNFTSNLSSEQKIDFSVLIYPKDSEHNYSFYSYLYSGAYCYSCENNSNNRDSNMTLISLNQFQNYSHDFSLIPDQNLDLEKEYKIKVKFFKDDRKTADELTKEIHFYKPQTNNSSNEENSSEENFAEENNSVIYTSTPSLISQEELPSNESLPLITGAVTSSKIYESTGTKSLTLVPIFLIISASLLLIFLWRIPNRNP